MNVDDSLKAGSHGVKHTTHDVRQVFDSVGTGRQVRVAIRLARPPPILVEFSPHRRTAHDRVQSSAVFCLFD
jgi:hypothetical protein